MKTTRRPRVLHLVCVTAVLVALGGCGGSESTTGPGPLASPDENARSSSSAPGDGGTCVSVIPDSVLATLEWTGGSGPTEDRGGCVSSSDQGEVFVLRGAETFDDACARVEGAAPAGTFRPKFENADDLQACGYVRDDDLGQSEVVVVDDRAASGVVSITVSALQPTSPDRVSDALAELSGATSDAP